jgi:hypothetical protein
MTRFATKLAIIRPAIQAFLTDPSDVLRGSRRQEWRTSGQLRKS